MSSFRIDRQYVSFVSAEAHSIITGSKLPETETGKDKAKADISAEEIKKQYELLREKTLREAEERAAKLIAEAQAEAKRITEEAEKKAHGLTEEAKGKAEQLRNKAKTEGYNEGMKNADKASEARHREERDSFALLQKSLKETYSNLVDGMRDEVISLVFGIVKKVINIKLNESDEVFMSLVNSAVEELKNAGSAAIHISSEDYKRYFGKEPAENFAGKGKINVVEEEEFGSGDLVAESDGEILDYSIGRQLDRLEKVFREAAKS